MRRRLDTAAQVFQFILDNSLLLLGGAALGLVWANADPGGYAEFARVTRPFVNDVAMVFFFGLVMKEVYEATLPGGPLSQPAEAAMPVLAAVGGMAAPALIYVLFVTSLGRADELMRGWAIPCATDIAFSYMAARLIFPARHPAIPFLLLLAVADDALGLLILAIFYPAGDVRLGIFALLLVPALAIAWALRRRRVKSFWPYVLAGGGLSWAAFYIGGLHPALALVTIVSFLPSVGRYHELFDEQAADPTDTLDVFASWWRVPVQVVLFFFGLANAGVPLSSVGPVTWMVAGALLAGKPAGVLLLTAIAVLGGLKRPGGLTYAEVAISGITAGIGFTVALFFATAAFPPGPILDQAKMGALLSFIAAPLAIAAGRLARSTGTARPRSPT